MEKRLWYGIRDGITNGTGNAARDNIRREKVILIWIKPAGRAPQ